MRRRINLHIEELALEGIPSADRLRVAAGLRRELTERLSGPDLPSLLASDRELRSVTTDAITLEPRMRPESVGRDAAAEIWRGLGGSF